MKTLITAAVLLALGSPAFAAKANPRDFSDIRKWQDLDWQCNYSVFPREEDIDVHSTKEEVEKSARGKVCIAADKLEKKLTAKGYCTYGRSGVGRAGRKYFYPGYDGPAMARHCYIITNMPERLD